MALPNGHWSDLIDEFLDFTVGVTSPLLFRKWSAISLVAGALERRVWAKVGDYQTFPNIYVLLVGPPGVGKQVIDTTAELWQTAPDSSSLGLAFHTAPDSLSKASLMDTLATAKRAFLPPSGALVSYHSLLVAVEEFQLLLPAYDQEFISALNRIFNNPPQYKERRRQSIVKELTIAHPQLNILGGATPSYFVGTFPDEAWTTGLSRRILMIYSSDTPSKLLFEETPSQASRKQHLLTRLSALSSLYGQIAWRASAAQRLGEWDAEGGSRGRGGPPFPTHSKLEHYMRSRTQHAIKLAIISAVARSGALVIELEDVYRAIEWLIEAESLMPDIFRAMVGKSDVQVLEELHLFAQQMWVRQNHTALKEDMLRRFLMTRVPHDKITGLLDTADRAMILTRAAGTNEWTPRPKHEHGVE